MERYVILTTTDDKHIGQYFTFNLESKKIKINNLDTLIPFDYIFNNGNKIRLLSSHYTIIGKIVN